jgi:ribosome maturation protein Sdo1
MMKRLRHWIAPAMIVALIFGSTMLSSAAAKEKAKPDKALERTRKTVRMLDDLYKTAVVLITKHYVNDGKDLPAGTAAIALFSAMKDKGWHEVRLLDATGDPIEANNAPRDKFEKDAIAALKAGKPYFEQVVKKGGARYLRAATPIPVVMSKCIMCHDNYSDVEKG